MASYRGYTIDGPIDGARHLRELLQASGPAHGERQYIGMEKARPFLPQ